MKQTDWKSAKKYYARMMIDLRFPLRRSSQILRVTKRAPLRITTFQKIEKRLAVLVSAIML
jgi:hypothetical protein